MILLLNVRTDGEGGMTKNKIIHSDCLDSLKCMKENSVDTIISDPPYGLGDSLNYRVNETVRKSFNIMLPKFNEKNTKRVKYSDLSLVSIESSDLSGFETINTIEPFVGVPESTINLNGDIKIRKEEIERSAISSSFNIPNTVLVNKTDIKGSKFIGNYIFDFGNSIDFTTNNVLSGNFGQFLPSGFSVPISSIVSSCFPNLLSDYPFPFYRDGILDFIWTDDDTRTNATSSGFILTGSRTEMIPVLTFQRADGSGDFFSTITTVNSDTISNFICPKLVRTSLTTSSLSPMLEPVKVSFVLRTANGTTSNYFLHLYLPKNMLNSLTSIYENASGFMAKKWDYDVPAVEIWKECLRVLKPGGYALIFAGARTQHRMAVNIEDAGFRLMDTIMWIYGTGFPKNMNISKAIDKKLGKKREIIPVGKPVKRMIPGADQNKTGSWIKDNGREYQPVEEIAGSDMAQAWDGYGTALKPAYEPIIVAMKPIKGTYADSAIAHGVAGLNIDECRVGESVDTRRPTGKSLIGTFEQEEKISGTINKGRFPANVILTHHDDCKFVGTKEIKNKSGSVSGNESSKPAKNTYGKYDRKEFKKHGENGIEIIEEYVCHEDCPIRIMDEQSGIKSAGKYKGEGSKSGDKGGASRFFKIIKGDKCINANIADKNLNLQRKVEDFVQNLVAIRDDQEGKQLKNIILPFMNEMQKVLKINSVQNIKKMKSIGIKCVQELKHTSMEMLKCDHVAFAEIQKLINTMMIIQNLLNIDGFVEVVMSNIILTNMVLGERASRFKYCAKASRSERNKGLEELPKKNGGSTAKGFTKDAEKGLDRNRPTANFHPTVKPLALMTYLANLTKTPTGGVVLDPFAGSGSTALACIETGRDYIMIERELDYINIMKARIKDAIISEAKSLDEFF